MVDTVKCIIPFTQFFVIAKGYCYSCCPPWTVLGNVGKLNDQSIMDVWNGERMQYVRKAILENKLEKVCNFKYCPYAIEYKDIDLNNCKGDDHHNAIIEQIKQGKTILETGPYVLAIASSGKCNLRCIMCESNEKFIPDLKGLEENMYSKLLPDILPKISRLQLTGNGDPLHNKHSRRFLQTLDPSKYPSLKIKFITNGNLFTPKIWHSIKHNNYDAINVSIDGATKETYEKVRKNGKWEVLMNNLELISNLRRENKFAWFVISFVVLKSNYKEIKQFAELGIRLGCDKVIFQKNFSLINVKENINIVHDKKIMIEIAQILKDPVFDRPEIDTTIIESYKNYANSSHTFVDNIFTKVKTELMHYPLLSLYSMIKVAPFLIDLPEIYRNKIRPLVKTNKLPKGIK